MFEEQQEVELDEPEAQMAKMATNEGTALEPVAPAPADDDVIAAAEEAVRNAIIAHADQCIATLTDALKKSPKAAARALHLIRNVADTQSQMLVSLGLGEKTRKRRRQGIYLNSGSAWSGEVDAELGYSSGGELAPGGETFGNQALKQVIAAFQPIAAAALTQRNAEAEQRKLSSVNELTQAVAVAREKDLPLEITTALQNKLKELLKPVDETAPQALPVEVLS